jgi:hypothetical protein
LANGYTLNSVTADLAPYTVRWRDFVSGTDHDGREIIGIFQEIDLAFEAASAPYARQWLERASSGSLNMDVLDQNKIAYRTLSGVFLKVVDYPAVEGTWSTGFAMMVTKVRKV